MMPACIVFGCSTTSRNKSEDVVLHVFPKNREKIEVWLLNIGVVKELLDIQSTIILADHLGNQFVVCSLHFAPDQYEPDLRCKTGRPHKSKRLRSDAVPTLFHSVMLMPTAALNLVDQPVASMGNAAAAAVLKQFNLPACQGWGHLITSRRGRQAVQVETGICSKAFGLHEAKKTLVHQSTQTDFSSLNVDQGTDPVLTWTDLMSHMLVLAKEKVIMKDQFIQCPEYEHNMVGATLEVAVDHNYPQAFLMEKLVNTINPAKLSKPVKLPKPQLEPEPVWIDSEESDYDERFLLKENRVKDPDYCPSVEEYSTDRAGEDKLSDGYTDEECANSVLEQQQEVTAGECLTPEALHGNNVSNAEQENPKHWQYMNQVGPIPESSRQPECLDSSVFRDENMEIKIEQEVATDREHPQISAVVDGGRLLIAGKEEEETEARLLSFQNNLLFSRCRLRLSEGRKSLSGYGSLGAEKDAPDVTDLQNVLPVEAEGCPKRLFSPLPSDSGTCRIRARKCIRFLSSGTKINEVLGNMMVSKSCNREERDEIPTVGQDFSRPIEAHRLGRCFNLELGVQYKCTNCDITFTHYESRIILRSFRGTVELPSCPNCGLKCCEKVPQMNAEAAYMKHTCSQCKENFQTSDELNRHLAATSHKPFWCAECERGFKNKTGLRWHKECRHSSCKEVKCKECGKCFDRKQSLTVHRRNHKKYSSENAAKLLKAQTPCKNYYQCSECSQTFNSAFHFLTHERCHTGERPFKCRKCRKRFKQKSHLLRHLLIHGIGKPFQCEVCEKGFTKHCNYVKHVDLHKETNPSCSECGQTFTTTLCLKRHERDKHSDGTVHKCDECGKEFRLIHYFLKHQKTHLQEGMT